MQNGSTTLRILLAAVVIVAIASGTVLTALGVESEPAWTIAGGGALLLAGQHLPTPGRP